MERWCCALMLLCSVNTAAAAWERAGATDDGAVIYADPVSLKKTDDVVNMWSLLDYKTPEKDAAGNLYSSVKLMQEFDCKTAQGRTRFFSVHAGPMGTGALVHSEMRANSEWRPANGARTGELLWQTACGKK
jgi:hypothetical protein